VDSPVKNAHFIYQSPDQSQEGYYGHMSKFLLLMLFALAPGLVSAQVASDQGAWTWIALEGQLFENGEEEQLKELKRFRYNLEFHYRTKGDGGDFNSAIVRPYLGYSIGPDMDVWVGYAYVPFEKGGAIQHEHRLVQMLTYKTKLGEKKAVLFMSKTRLEERFVEDHHEISVRVRQLAKLSIPLPFTPAEKKFKIFFSDEILFNLNSTYIKGEAGKFENRMSVGISMETKLLKMPATITVAPKSPRARAKANATPATIPRRARGRVTWNTTRRSVSGRRVVTPSSHQLEADRHQHDHRGDP
jgi:hypothetical protein